MSEVYWGLAGTLVTQGPEGGIRGHLGVPRGYLGLLWGIRECQGCIWVASELGA